MSIFSHSSEKSDSRLELDYAPFWRRFLSVMLIIFAVVIWFAAVGAVVLPAFLTFARAAVNSKASNFWEDMMLIAPIAVIFVGSSLIAKGFVPALKTLLLRLEDIVGRGIVFIHSATHTFSVRKGNFFRGLFAFLAISLTLFFELVFLRWAIRNFPRIPLNASASHTFIALSGNARVFLFSLNLTAVAIIAYLLLRFTVSNRWQAIYAKPQFLEEELLTPPDGSSNVRILHATDLHITSTDDEGLIEGGEKFTSVMLKSVMESIAKDALSCDAILVTGDITDTGSAEAWKRFLENSSAETINKMILVPGNHDLNLQDPSLFFKAEKHNSPGRCSRQLRMINVMIQVMGERALLLDHSTDRLFTLKTYLERHHTRLSSTNTVTVTSRHGVNALWQDLFPMIVPVGINRNGKRLGVLVLDSVKPGSIGLTNAIGMVSQEVIEKCSTLMNKMADQCDCFVIALHHHVAMPTGGSVRERFQNSGLVLENASLLIDMLAGRGDPTIVFHGHRHKTYTGVATDTNVAIVSSPSASIGKENTPGKGSWRIADLYCSDAGCWLVDIPKRCSVQNGDNVV